MGFPVPWEGIECNESDLKFIMSYLRRIGVRGIYPRLSTSGASTVAGDGRGPTPPTLERIGRFLAPHFSSSLGVEEPKNAVSGPWREDPRGVPPRKVFDEELIAINTRDFRLQEHTLKNKLSDNMIQIEKDVTSAFLRDRIFHILCLDGGGVRGILTVNILLRIIKEDPKFLDKTDALFGTSVGGILALLLASGYDAEECEEIFRFAMPHIFRHDPYRKMNPFNSKYSDRSKEELMRYYFGDLKMGDLKKFCTVIAFRLDGRRSETHSFFNTDGWRPAILSNMPVGKSDVLPDSDLRVWEAAMRTSAAPTFFPVYQGYTDGGVVANNPSIIALSKVMAHFPTVNTRNAALLSLGAGFFPRHTEIFDGTSTAGETYVSAHGRRRLGARADWGIKQLLPFLLDITLDGDSLTAEMVMHYLTTAQGTDMYHRFDPRLPNKVPLDDIDRVEEMKEFALGLNIDETLSYVKRFWLDEVDAQSMGRSNSGEWATLGDNALEGATSYNEAWFSALSDKEKERRKSR